MAKLSMYARERVVALHFSGKNVTQIKKTLVLHGTLVFFSHTARIW